MPKNQHQEENIGRPLGVWFIGFVYSKMSAVWWPRFAWRVGVIAHLRESIPENVLYSCELIVGDIAR